MSLAGAGGAGAGVPGFEFVDFFPALLAVEASVELADLGPLRLGQRFPEACLASNDDDALRAWERRAWRAERALEL